MKNNIGVFSTHALWPSHFETELEIIQDEINAGNIVTVFHCDTSIKQCETIWNRAFRQKKAVTRVF